MEHSSYRELAPLWNTLLTVDQPHRGTPYSAWTCPTRKTLLPQPKKTSKKLQGKGTNTQPDRWPVRLLDQIGQGAWSLKKRFYSTVVLFKMYQTCYRWPKLKNIRFNNNKNFFLSLGRSVGSPSPGQQLNKLNLHPHDCHITVTLPLTLQ